MTTNQPAALGEAGRRLRIYVGERERDGQQPLYMAIVQAAKRAGLRGATAFKAVLGYGAHSEMHAATVIDLSSDMPIVIEMVDSVASIAAFMPVLLGMLGDGLVTAEDVAIVYRGAEKPA
jgi:PII-like signaling protein